MLPLELLTRVVDFIEPKHLFTFRSICKGFCDASNGKFAKAYFESVHIRRSRKSLNAFLDVTASPNVAQAIRQIEISAYCLKQDVDLTDLVGDPYFRPTESLTLLDFEAVKRQYAEMLAEQHHLEESGAWELAITRGLEHLTIFNKPLTIAVSLYMSSSLGEGRHCLWPVEIMERRTASTLRACIHSAYQSKACIGLELQFKDDRLTSAELDPVNFSQ